MNEKTKKFLNNSLVQSVITSLFCIFAGLFIGFIVLLIINPGEAAKAISVIIKNYFWYPNPVMAKRAFGTTLVKTAPLLMCSLSVLFAYKTGLFNIGAAGQYVAGAGVSMFFALKIGAPWYVCLVLAVLAGAFWGAISGVLKAKCNVNEVISCIMLNWISLYCVNMLLSPVKEPTSPHVVALLNTNPKGALPSLGLGSLFGRNKHVTIAIFLAVIVAVIIWILLDKTKFGYELKATGLNKYAAKYCGMNENRNIIVTMAISGGLAGMGAAFYYLSGFEQWSCSSTNLPAMGFNGIAAAFLGGLHPIGAIFSSYFIQHITDGGTLINKSVYSSQISDLISSIIIYLCGFVLFLKTILNNILAKRENRQAEEAEKKASLQNGGV
ncbi:MAG: ABC transporter permease [Treponemataceae bacterium]|nr:ABC transporter permease [Treponemataceae bacterium]